MSFLGRFNRSLHAFKRELTRRVPVVPALGAVQVPSIGLALGGGFARGLAHVGVLKVFEAEGIKIDCIAGTSAGAVIGALYCSGISARELEKIAGSVRFKDFARYTVSRRGLYTNDRMSSFLKRVLKVRTFEELRIPLAVTATDFLSGEAVIFRSGPLIDPVRASCAYPGVFLPVKMEGRILVDGLLTCPVPVRPLREMGAEKTIAVSLRAQWVDQHGPKHVLEVIGQCFSIVQANTRILWQRDVDVSIEPDVTGFSFDAFEHAAELVQKGEEAARALLPEIKSWLPRRSPSGAPGEMQSVSSTAEEPAVS